MPIVIDVSVMACWHFEGEENGRADAIQSRLLDEVVIVPSQWWFEMRNVLIVGERRMRATPEQSAEFLNFLSNLRIAIAILPDEDVVFDLARRHRLTFYDAAYLELAKREACPLATFDNALIRAAQAEGVVLA